MIRLKISNFSCINSADFEVGKFNVIIGPQASGKSVVCKLLYFFVQALLDTVGFDYYKTGDAFEHSKFDDVLKNNFRELFPESAWGHENFKIDFQINNFSLSVMRTLMDNGNASALNVLKSSSLVSFLYDQFTLYHDIQADFAKSISRLNNYKMELEFGRQVLDRLVQEIQGDEVHFQTYIPAGRSFFTNIDRRLFSSSSNFLLDPITLKFARLFFYALSKFDHERYHKHNHSSEVKFTRILGGSLIWKSDEPMFKNLDSRIVPFSSLSSGQQELLPLALAVEFKNNLSHILPITNDILYIEEPETHLFPAAQSDILEELVAMSRIENHTITKLIITTHSPYVLTKLNCLAKAGELEMQLKDRYQTDLDYIINKESRIAPGELRAYALVNKSLINIIDDYGLINAEYLDAVSDSIGDEFSRLIDLEEKSNDT
jgi:AAA15 family ATPase/GTPase